MGIMTNSIPGTLTTNFRNYWKRQTFGIAIRGTKNYLVDFSRKVSTRK